MAIRRKSIVGSIVGMTNGVVALFVAVGIFRYILTNESALPEGKIVPFLVALGIFTLNITYVVLVVKDVMGGGGESRYITARADGGSARISLRALRKALRRGVLEDEGVRSVRLRIRRAPDGSVRVSATVRSTHEENALALAGRVRNAIRDHFFRLVPDDGKMTVHVVVKIAEFGTTHVTSTIPPDEVDPDPEPTLDAFTGPRYPVDDIDDGDSRD